MSAKFKNTSFNEHLLPGLDLVNKLVSVLLRFQEGKCAVMADIQNMFHQVNVCSKDVDAMRLVWRDNQEQLKSDFCMMLVHIF